MMNKPEVLKIPAALAKGAPHIRMQDIYGGSISRPRTISKVGTGTEGEIKAFKEYYGDLLKTDLKFTEVNPKEMSHHSFGVELEIEGCGDTSFTLFRGWRLERDGSLRNSGIELLSPPASLEYLFRMLPIQLALTKEYNKREIDFSWRTSSHVHVDISGWTKRQVSIFLLLYMILEKALFRVSSWERTDSIFCVPINSSNLVEVIRRFLHEPDYLDIAGSWQKYSALNFTRLRDYGTVEWRHFEGARDIQSLLRWMGIIDELNKYVDTKGDDFEENTQFLSWVMSLNTSSDYDRFIYSIFSNKIVSERLMSLGDFRSGISEGISAAKAVIVNKSIGKMGTSRMPDVKPSPEGVGELVAKKSEEQKLKSELERLLEMENDAPVTVRRHDDAADSLRDNSPPYSALAFDRGYIPNRPPYDNVRLENTHHTFLHFDENPSDLGDVFRIESTPDGDSGMILGTLFVSNPPVDSSRMDWGRFVPRQIINELDLNDTDFFTGGVGASPIDIFYNGHCYMQLGDRSTIERGKTYLKFIAGFCARTNRYIYGIVRVR